MNIQDKLMTLPSEASSGSSSTSWLFKNKEHGKASAAASLVCFMIHVVVLSTSWMIIVY